jgi:hypothetical protein
MRVIILAIFLSGCSTLTEGQARRKECVEFILKKLADENKSVYICKYIVEGDINE